MNNNEATHYFEIMRRIDESFLVFLFGKLTGLNKGTIISLNRD